MAIEANPKNDGPDVYWQLLDISKQDRRRLKGHHSAIVWLTGLPASGKTTIARELEKRLHTAGIHTYTLDGDNLRHGLNRDLGFSKEHRRENIRRIAEVAKLLMEAGVLTICAFVSPYQQDRRMAKSLVERNEFVEIYLKCPLSVCASRDPKGLYRKAIAGEITGFTGIDDPYEAPEAADVTIETDRRNLDQSVEAIIGYLKENNLIAA